jgi:hypothetical protein
MTTFLIILTLASMGLGFVFGRDELIRGVSVLLIFVSSLLLGSVSKQDNGVKSKTKINPSIEVICKDTICDTTYIYKIKE